ncbi:hypothetical protein TNCT6_57250 [Streptomyces sp. 6-11-2]|nr:hypothetical protein TNCT6_57250 [Streptomyces sp. 6-11-2]
MAAKTEDPTAAGGDELSGRGAQAEPGLDESQPRNLLDRARNQIDVVEELRRTAAAAVFSLRGVQTSDAH